jgi:hypothetical protein
VKPSGGEAPPVMALFAILVLVGAVMLLPARRTRVAAALALLITGSALAQSSTGQRFQFDSPVGVVMRLYHDFAFQAVIDQNVPYGDVLNEPKSVLERYFDPAVTRLILAEQKCAIAAGGICNIDHMVMWNSQDATGVSVEIKPSAQPDKVEVILRYPGFPPGSLMYTVTKTSHGFRIHDIRSDKWSLIGLLKGRFDGP